MFPHFGQSPSFFLIPVTILLSEHAFAWLWDIFSDDKNNDVVLILYYDIPSNVCRYMSLTTQIK